MNRTVTVEKKEKGVQITVREGSRARIVQVSCRVFEHTLLATEE